MALGVMPEEIPIDYGVLFGQDTMRQLILGTSIRYDTISWDNAKAMMIPHTHWYEKRIVK